MIRFKWLPVYTAAFLATFAIGCEASKSTPSGGRVDVDVNPEARPGGEVDVRTGPGGVDVEAGREGRKAVDVDVEPGGVKVDVDGEAIRDRIQERREERQRDKAAE